MKKILFSLTIGLLLASALYANKTDRMTKKEARKEKREMRTERRNISKSEVSYMMEQQFAIDFPDATEVSFQKSKWFDEGDFTLNGKRTRAYYDIHSKLVGTTNKVLFSDLPLSAQQDIRKWYTDYQVKEVFMFDDNEENDSDMIMYGSAFEDADNYFVQLEKGSKDIVVKVTPRGIVSYYTQLRKA